MQNESLVTRMEHVSDVVDHLVKEQQLVGRFPCRFVFVNSLSVYNDLTSQLRNKADKSLFLSDDKYCHGDDVIPRLDEITNEIAQSQDVAFVLEPFGEYLRLAENNLTFTQKIKSLLTIECSSRTRVWIPIFCGKSILFSAVGQLNFRYENAFFEITSDKISHFALNVCPPSIKGTSGTTFMGLKQWLHAWEKLNAESGSLLLTRHVTLFSPSGEMYAVNVIKDPFSFLQEKLSDAGSLHREMGSEYQWGWLAGKINAKTTTVDSLIKMALNVQEFKPLDILAKWNDGIIDENSKWIFWLWYQKGGISGGDYISYAVATASSADYIPRRIEVAILDEGMRNNLDVAQEQRKNALRLFRDKKRSKEFWEKFELISDDHHKMKLLTDYTKEERVAIIKTASDLLRKMPHHAGVFELIKRVYPVLAIYLKHTSLSEYTSFSAYFDKYRLLKIQDIFDSALDDLYSKSSLLEVTNRHELLKSVRKNNEFTLIIDGLGLEWLDLLLYFVKARMPSVKYNIHIGAANIPTVTSANHFWDDWENSSYKKDDRLDAKSHIKDKSDGIDPFDLTELQFSIINEIANDIAELLESRGHLIVTSDHGLSRMAAIHFHQLNPTLPPHGAEVRNFGRFCLVSEGYNNSNPNCYRDGEVLVMVTHEHFVFSGNLSGETHGGMTPEEYLVPVITFSHPNAASHVHEVVVSPAPEINLYESKVNLLPNKNAEFIVESSLDLKSIKGKISSEIVEGTIVSARKWKLSFSNLRAGGSYELIVYPDSSAKFSKKFNVAILRHGLIVEDDF